MPNNTYLMPKKNLPTLHCLVFLPIYVGIVSNLRNDIN